MPVGEIALDRPISVGVFIEVSRWPKKRCLALSKAERAADFACGLSVRPPAASPREAPRPALAAGDVGGFERGGEVAVDDAEGVRIGVVDRPLRLRQLVLDELVAHALVGERPSRCRGRAISDPAPAPPWPRRRRPRCLDEGGSRREGEARPAPGRAARHRRGCGRSWLPWPTRRGRGHPAAGAESQAGAALLRRSRPPRSPSPPVPPEPSPPPAFCMAWLSSKTTTPSKPFPSHSTIWLTRDALTPPERASCRSSSARWHRS